MKKLYYSQYTESFHLKFSSVQFSHSVVSDSLWPHELQHARPTCPSPTPRVHPNSWPSSQWYQSNHVIFCHPLLLLPSIFPNIRVFSNESALCIRWPEYWSFSISPSNEYSWMISFRIDWFDLSAVQGTLKSLLQDRNSKASVLQCSAFFTVQLLYGHIRTWLLEKPLLWLYGSLSAKRCLCFLTHS